MKKTYLPKLFLIINADIIDPAKSKRYNGSILIKNGKIEKIGKIISVPDAKVFDAKGKIVTHGFCDLHVHFREPGREDKETISSGAKAAIIGGFTEVCTMPNTSPVIDNVSMVDFLKRRGRDKSKINIYPTATLTKNLEATLETPYGLLGFGG